MATVTIEVPDDVAERLAQVKEEERDSYAAALLSDGMDDFSPEEVREEFEDRCRCIAQGYADIDAGRVVTVEEAHAHAIRALEQAKQRRAK